MQLGQVTNQMISSVVVLSADGTGDSLEALVFEQMPLLVRGLNEFSIATRETIVCMSFSGMVQILQQVEDMMTPTACKIAGVNCASRRIHVGASAL